MAINHQNENVFGALCYLLGFVTGIIFLLVEEKNRFVRFHAMQSTILFGGLFVISAVVNIVPLLGQLISSLLGLLGLILWVVCIFKAFQGDRYHVPYVGEIAEQQLAR